MSNHISHLLQHWYAHRDQADWVLGVVYRTQGPCYRKAGAAMLFSSRGQQFGLLSGGCLESDIQRHAINVMQTGEPTLLCYDSNNEDDISYQLGIGCGGKVEIMLLPINEANNYLALTDLYLALSQQQHGYYYIAVANTSEQIDSEFALNNLSTETFNKIIQPPAHLIERQQQAYLKILITPPPHILLVGGGIDARPLAQQADSLGWQVSVWDPRPANARVDYFSQCQYLLKGEVEQLNKFIHQQHIDACILMSHSVKLDSLALKQVNNQGLGYLALLGPVNRQQEVLKQAGLTKAEVLPKLAGPAGLDIGAQLPESIALAILAECHSALTKRSAQSLSDILTTN